MAIDHRIVIDGEPVPYTCGNKLFQTNVALGEPHGRRRARGSVSERPFIENGEYSLWLEYVVNLKSGESGDLYWLMWYRKGIPTIPLSGVFRSAQWNDMLLSLEKLRTKKPRKKGSGNSR